jgi:hypothetical protein
LDEKSVLYLESSDLPVSCKQTWLPIKHKAGGDLNAILSAAAAAVAVAVVVVVVVVMGNNKLMLMVKGL